MESSITSGLSQHSRGLTRGGPAKQSEAEFPYGILIKNKFKMNANSLEFITNGNFIINVQKF